MSRVLIVGWDGADWALIERWRHQLPNLSRLMDTGASLRLRSTAPAITPVAWPSMFTGLNPGKHGVFDWTVGFPWEPRRPVGVADICGRPIWNQLSVHQRTSIVAGVPFSFPPQPFQGVMIGSWFTPSNRSEFFVDSTVADAIRPVPDLGKYPDKMGFVDPDEFQRLYRDVMFEQTDAVGKLMDVMDWDLAFAVYPITDQYSHWNLPLRDAYRSADTALGMLLESAGPEVNVFVVSDHGTARPERQINLYTWLMERGLFRLRPAVPRSVMERRLNDLLSRFRKLAWVARDRTFVQPAGFLWCHIPIACRRILSNLIRDRFGFLYQEFDLDRTLVIVGGSNQLYVLDRAKYAVGALQTKRAHQLIDELGAALLDLRDPELGTPLFQAVRKSEDIFCGPYVSRSADLYLESFEDRYSIGTGRWARLRSSSLVTRRGPVAEHSANGVWIAAGPEVKRLGNLQQARLEDVFSTALCLLGVPIPQNVDGRVVDEIVAPDYLREAPPVYEHGVALRSRSQSSEDLSQNGREFLEARLRSLGYL